MTTLQERRGIGTLKIGTSHHAGVEYRVWLNSNQGPGVISGEPSFLRDALHAPEIALVLDDGTVLSVAVRLHHPDSELADIEVFGTAGAAPQNP